MYLYPIEFKNWDWFHINLLDFTKIISFKD